MHPIPSLLLDRKSTRVGILMQRHLYSGKWIRPVTPEGRAALEHFHPGRKARADE